MIPRRTAKATSDTHTRSGDHGAGAKRFLMLNLYPARPGDETRSRLGFAVDDLDAAARLVRAGVAVRQPPERKPWGRSAVYADLDMNVVSLTERPWQPTPAQLETSA